MLKINCEAPVLSITKRSVKEGVFDLIANLKCDVLDGTKTMVKIYRLNLIEQVQAEFILEIPCTYVEDGSTCLVVTSDRRTVVIGLSWKAPRPSKDAYKIHKYVYQLSKWHIDSDKVSTQMECLSAFVFQHLILPDNIFNCY